MPVAALLPVIVSAFLHALWNALLKREKETDVAAVGVLAVSALCSIAIALVAVKDAHAWSSGLGWAVLAGLAEAGYFVTLALALARAPLGRVYTVARGGAIVTVWPISAIWLGESVTLPAAIGAAVLCLGLAATGFDRGQPRPGRGLGWAVLCALCIAAYHVSYKQGLSARGEPVVLCAISMSVAVPLNLLWIGRSGITRLGRLLRERPVPVIGAGVLCSGSFVIFLSAMTGAGAGAVLTLRNTSVLFAQGLAWAIGERPRRNQLVGALLVAAGAALIGWPRQ